MRQFLNKELSEKQQKIDNMKYIVNRILGNYETYYSYIGTNFAYVKFNGVLTLDIGVNEIKLKGWNITNAPNAKTYRSDTGSMIGIISYQYEKIDDDMFKWIVNNLAQYEKIFPK